MVTRVFVMILLGISANLGRPDGDASLLFYFRVAGHFIIGGFLTRLTH